MYGEGSDTAVECSKSTVEFSGEAELAATRPMRSGMSATAQRLRRDCPAPAHVEWGRRLLRWVAVRR